MTSAVGKRTSTDQPLTEHDVAERLDKAAMRVLKILVEVREMDILPLVKSSRYLTNSLNALAAELQAWDIEPVPMKAGVQEPIRAAVQEPEPVAMADTCPTCFPRPCVTPPRTMCKRAVKTGD